MVIGCNMQSSQEKSFGLFEPSRSSVGWVSWLKVCAVAVLALLLHGVLGYGLRFMKGHAIQREKPKVVQVALLPVVEETPQLLPVKKPEVIEPKPKPQPKLKPKPKKRKKIKKPIKRKKPKPKPRPKPPSPPPPEVVQPVEQPLAEPLLVATSPAPVAQQQVYVPPAPAPAPAPKVEPASASAPVASESADEADSTALSAALSDDESAAPPSAPAVVNARISQADYLSNPKPKYPRISRRLGEQGVVRLEVLVSKQGRAKTVRVVGSSGFERLDDVARRTVQRSWKFSPKRVNGLAVAQRVRFNMPFVLQ